MKDGLAILGGLRLNLDLRLGVYCRLRNIFRFYRIEVSIPVSVILWILTFILLFIVAVVVSVALRIIIIVLLLLLATIVDDVFGVVGVLTPQIAYVEFESLSNCIFLLK